MSTFHPLQALLQERVVIIDGAMGTTIQQYGLTEEQFRGERFKDWTGKDLKGNNELLNLTQPQIIEEIHRRYFEAGADIATCPLSSILGLLKHPLTDIGLEQFIADYKKVEG